MQMNTKILGTLVVLAVLVVGVVSMSGYAQKSDEESAGEGTTVATPITENKELLTSREAVRIAQPVAGNWASDAVLVDLSNFRGSSELNGRAIRWKLEFNSANMEKELEVHVSRGKILQTIEEKYKERDAITGEWIDSPEAMDIAREYFGDEPVKNYWLGLSSHEETVSWYIKCDHSEDTPTWVQLNALTGEFIKTREGY